MCEDAVNPEKEPYKHKYEARKIYQDLEKTFDTTFKKQIEDNHQILVQAAAVNKHLLACNYFETEENSDARKVFL